MNVLHGQRLTCLAKQNKTGLNGVERDKQDYTGLHRIKQDQTKLIRFSRSENLL